MAHYTGALLEGELDGVLLDAIREVIIPDEQPAPDVTHATDAHGQYVPVGITYRNGCSMAFVDDDSAATWSRMPGGTTGTLAVYPHGKVGGAQVLTMQILVTHRGRPLKFDDATFFTVTFNVLSYATGVVVQETCLTGGAPSPMVIATYAPDAVEVGGAIAQGIWVQGVDADETYAYLASFAYYDLATDRNVIDRVPIAENGEMLTGVLSRDLRYENATGWQGLVHDIRVTETYVYAGGVNGLWIFDKALTLVGRCDYMEFGWEDAPFIQSLEVSADENYLFVGGSGFGVAVIDVTNKAAPAVVWYDTYTDCEMLVLQEPYLYAVDDWWHFVIYDVTTPSSPSNVFENFELFEGIAYPTGQDASGDLAVFTSETDTVILYSIVDRELPVELAQITVSPETPGNYVGIAGARIIGQYLVLWILDNGETGILYFYDISSPDEPALAESLSVLEMGSEVEQGWLRSVDNRYLVVSHGLVSAMAVIDSCMPN